MNSEEVFEIDIVKVIRMSWAKKYIVIGISSVFVISFIGISYLFTPIFRTQAVLAPISSDMTSNNPTSNLGGLASLVGVGVAGGSDESTVNMAVFQSRRLIRELVLENNLQPILYPDNWDGDKKTWKDEEPTLWEIVNYFDNDIRSIVIDQETGLVTLSINWIDPEVAVKWVELIIAKVNKILHEEYLNETRKNSEYLKEQLLTTQNAEMRSILFSLIQEQIKKEMLSKTDQEFAYKVIDPAVVPDKKNSPKRSLFAILGLFLGGIVGVMYVCISDYKDKKVSRNSIG